MDPLSAAVGALAAAAGIARVVGIFRRNVNSEMFTRIAIEQINKGSVDRVRRICEAIPSSAYPAVARAAVEAADGCDAKDGREVVEQTIRDAFDAAYREQMQTVSQWAWLAPVAAALGAGAVILAVTAPDDRIELAIAAGLLGALAGMWSIVVYRRIRRDPITLGESIVDALVDHVMRATGSPKPNDTTVRGDPSDADLEPIDELGDRTVPAGVTTIAATRARSAARAGSNVFDMRRGNCGMCGHDDVAIMERGLLKAYVCKGCGFAQWFADDPSTLDG